MKLILLGPPGVGKGTQADLLKDHYQIVHLSTGEILRGEISNQTETGIQAKKFVDKGQLVPDEILLEMMNHRLLEKDCVKGYLLDGFPRTVGQADGLNLLLSKIGQELDAVISLTADEDELINRLVLRGKTSGRSDDTYEVIRERQEVYRKMTEPLIKYYQKMNLVKPVEGMGSIDEISKRIIKTLES